MAVAENVSISCDGDSAANCSRESCEQSIFIAYMAETMQLRESPGERHPCRNPHTGYINAFLGPKNDHLLQFHGRFPPWRCRLFLQQVSYRSSSYAGYRSNISAECS